MYFSYRGLSEKKAVGFVVFGELTAHNVNRIEINNATHLPMLFARVRVGGREFSYLPFNGMVYDLQINYGRGYVSDLRVLITNILAVNPKPELRVLPLNEQPVLDGDM